MINLRVRFKDRKGPPTVTERIAIDGRKYALVVGVISEDEDVVMRALVNEYGMGVPERSFIRAWFDQHRTQVATWLRDNIRAAIKNKRSLNDVYEQCGQFIVHSIKGRIENVIQPENSPETIKRKGSTTPLIHTGEMLSSINYAVVKR